LSLIYLVRHGQAGARDNYDVLSDLGREQARLLGEYLVAQNIRPDIVISGSFNRQRLTAEIACQSFPSPPEIAVDHRWDEFRLASLYRAFATRLAAESEEFACDFEEMQRAIIADPHTTRGATGRCDRAMVTAWMASRFAYDGESWQEFQTRIHSLIPELSNHGGEQTIIVFTSATPISILTGAALGLRDEQLLRLMGVLYNSSITITKVQEEGLRLFTYNSTPHLPEPLKTLR
jgi:broad specificity phosphatase PhoE